MTSNQLNKLGLDAVIAQLSINILDLVNALPSMTLQGGNIDVEVISKGLLKIKIIDLFESLNNQ